MKFTNLALSLLAGLGAGCASVPPAPSVSLSNLPNCFDTNYDRERDLFTIKSDVGNRVNQQCLLTVGPRGDVASPQWLTVGRYRVYLSNGGGGGAGGTLQSFLRGGGGGAGAQEAQATVDLTEGVYKLTIGAGGPGGSVCLPNVGAGGGPGWFGAPSNMIRVATGEVVIGTPGADAYVRPTRFQQSRMAGKADAASTRIAGKPDSGHGGSGPGETSGGHGAVAATAHKDSVEPTAGAGKLVPLGVVPGGAIGTISATDKSEGVGGGGGATSRGSGGEGGGESPGQKENPPERGSLGSGGGGGEGSLEQCDPGARGGHGYFAARPI